MEYARINTFTGLNVVQDSPNAPQNSLAVAENVFVRPAGAIRRVPAFSKLWNMLNLRAYVEDDLGFDGTEGTVLLKVSVGGGTYQGNPRPEIVVLVAYDCSTWSTLGCFFVGAEDGRVPTSSELAGINLPANTGVSSPTILTQQYPVTINSLIGGLAVGKRVYFSRIYDEIWIGNGVDPNLIYTPSTGDLREAGTNSVPSKPLVGSVASLPAAAAVQPKLDVITLGTTGVTAGTATLRFTADSVNFKGTAGQNIQVRIVASGQNQAISSTRTGAGTSTSPFVYTLTIGTTAAQSSGDSIVGFVASDYNATGVVTASVTTTAPDANPSLSLAQTALSGGADEVTVGGHPLGVIYRFATTLYDPGPAGKNLGYEGPVGELSEEVVGYGDNDFIVTVAAKTGVDARFTKQNIWIREYLGEAYPSDPNGPFIWRKIRTVNNANGTYRITKNFTTTETSAEAPSQIRIPPCTMFEFAGNRMWAAGNEAEPYRVYLSKLATESERVPEGYAVKSYLDIEGKKEEPSRPRVTALRKLESRMQVHTDRSVTMIDANSLARIVSRSDFGAINPACLASWNRSNIPYLGADGTIYEMNNLQYYRSEPVAVAAWPKMRLSADIQALYTNPQRANMLADATNQIAIVWLPTTGEVGYSAFAMDFVSNSLTGPLHWPKLLSCSPVSTADSRYVGCNEDGDLFVFDLGFLHNDQFAENGPFTIRTGEVPQYTSRKSGLPYYLFPDQTYLENGMKCVFETQLLDLQEPNVRKGFYSLEWSTARHSRAIVKIVLTTDDGHSKTFECGEMYGKERNKIAFMISGNAIKVRFEAIIAENKPFIVRDLTIGYERQANVAMFMF